MRDFPKYMTPTVLFCNDYRVGNLTGAFFSDNTWYATVNLTLNDQSAFAQRIHSFITFCIDWHDRIDSDPDASEFDDFTDVVNESNWSTVADDGSQHAIHAAPVFLAGGDISWRPA